MDGRVASVKGSERMRNLLNGFGTESKASQSRKQGYTERIPIAEEEAGFYRRR